VLSSFINVTFGPTGAPGADDAIPPTTLDMNNVQDSIAKGGSDDDHAVGSGTVIKIDSSWVGEDSGCFGEGNAVFLEVRPSFLVVPLSHSKSPSMTVATAS
jgi:hypothetical protein